MDRVWSSTACWCGQGMHAVHWLRSRWRFLSYQSVKTCAAVVKVMAVDFEKHHVQCWVAEKVGAGDMNCMNVKVWTTRLEALVWVGKKRCEVALSAPQTEGRFRVKSRLFTHFTPPVSVIWVLFYLFTSLVWVSTASHLQLLFSFTSLDFSPSPGNRSFRVQHHIFLIWTFDKDKDYECDDQARKKAT